MFSLSETQFTSPCRLRAHVLYPPVPRVRRIVVPLVEEYMTEACADNGSHTYIYEQDAEPAFGDAFALEHAGYYIKANPKSDGEHQSVPAYGDKAVDNVVRD